MIEADASSTEEVVCTLAERARPTGGVMVSPPTPQRNASRGQGEGRAGKARKDRKKRGQGHYKGPEPECPARGLRRTTVGMVSRATSATPRAATTRLPSNGTCLTSSGRLPRQGMLATKGPGRPEGYPHPRKLPYTNSKLSNTRCIEDYQYDEDHED